MVWDVSPESPYEVFKGTELRNKTLGLVGYGNIGRRVARIARAFGMAVLVVDPFVAAEDINEPGLQKTTLEALFREADIVSLHLSSGPHSDGLVNAALLNSMKPGALLINTSRAAVVDEAALIDALRHGPLGGAALDVYHREPLWRDHPFVIEFDNVIITPHIAGATRESIAKHTAMIAADLQRYVAGSRCCTSGVKPLAPPRSAAARVHRQGRWAAIKAWVCSQSTTPASDPIPVATSAATAEATSHAAFTLSPRASAAINPPQ